MFKGSYTSNKVQNYQSLQNFDISAINSKTDEVLVKSKARHLPTAVTSASRSIGSGLGQINVSAGVTNVVQEQAFDVNGFAQITGGDEFVLNVENVCTVVNTYLCELSASSDNLSGLPIIKKMADNGDGTYTSDYLLS